LRVNSEGVRFAEAKAREISGLLLANTFSWDAYTKHQQEDIELVKTWGEIVVAFTELRCSISTFINSLKKNDVVGYLIEVDVCPIPI